MIVMESLDLRKLLDQNDWEDNTENIKKLKHSTQIRDDVRRIENLKMSFDGSECGQEPKVTTTNLADDPRSLNKFGDDFTELCRTRCSFLYDNYTDIFHKAVKNELDLTIMTKLLTVLKLIEDGKVNQHDGSVMVGKVLKELYVDSALKRIDNLDKEHTQEQVPKVEPHTINWREYKLREPRFP